MKRLIVLLTVLTTTVSISAAQHLQQELLSGADKMVFQMSYTQQWDQQSNVQINGLAFYNRFYEA